MLPEMDTSDNDELKTVIAKFSKQVGAKADSSQIDLLQGQIKRLQEALHTKARSDELARLSLTTKKGFEAAATQDQLLSNHKSLKTSLTNEVSGLQKQLATVEKQVKSALKQLETQVDIGRVKKIETKIDALGRDLAKVAAGMGDSDDEGEGGAQPPSKGEYKRTVSVWRLSMLI